MPKQPIHTDSAPAAIGTYSQAVRAGDTVYLSGQIPLDPVTMELREGVREQIDQVFKNLQAVARAAGGSLVRMAGRVGHDGFAQIAMAALKEASVDTRDPNKLNSTPSSSPLMFSRRSLASERLIVSFPVFTNSMNSKSSASSCPAAISWEDGSAGL